MGSAAGVTAQVEVDDSILGRLEQCKFCVVSTISSSVASPITEDERTERFKRQPEPAKSFSTEQ